MMCGMILSAGLMKSHWPCWQQSRWHISTACGIRNMMNGENGKIAGNVLLKDLLRKRNVRGQVFRPVSYTPYHRYQLYRMDWLKQCASMNRLSMKIRQSKPEHGKTPLTGCLKRPAWLLAFASKESVLIKRGFHLSG